ncbi:Uncharacterized protein Fot_06661 [Forsythia ovata]|uniref:Uncharacterized protein n=1 Tax=Forsythia ovata TaxID=205694 RepID=A0ABD1WTM2_9LAMI
MACNRPLLQPIQPQGASTLFVYTEAPELFQYHIIRQSFAHGNRLDNVVRVSICGRDHFDIFFFNPHISLATVNMRLDERIFDVFLDKHERQWKVHEYPLNIIAHWKVEALLDMFLHPYEYFNEVYSRYLETDEMEDNIEQSGSEEGD